MTDHGEQLVLLSDGSIVDPDYKRDSMNKRPDIKVLLLFIPVAYCSFLFHEFGHWTLGEIFGNEMTYSLNQVSPKSGQYVGIHDGVYSLLGGPAFTILQAAIFLLVIERFRFVFAYPFVFFAFFMRMFALVFGGFGKQDEAKISALLNIGPYTVAFAVLLVLFLILWRSGSTLKIGFRMNSIFCVASTDRKSVV
jgi:hypothetical protein